jgi:NitT/TauT family transport system ATP-binding protein
MQSWRSTVCLITHDVREAVFLADNVAALTNRPATLLKSFRIPFPHPRRNELLSTKEFLSICEQIEDALASQYGHD